MKPDSYKNKKADRLIRLFAFMVVASNRLIFLLYKRFARFKGLWLNGFWPDDLFRFWFKDLDLRFKDRLFRFENFGFFDASSTTIFQTIAFPAFRAGAIPAFATF